MGYYVDLTNHDLTIQAANFPAVIERWREFEKSEEFTSHYYSSIFDRDPDKLDLEPDIEQLFNEIGFSVNVQPGEDGGLEVEGWGEDGNGKSWLEAEYIHAIADLIDEGWSLDWHGEDDSHWRQTAGGTSTGTLLFADLDPIIQRGRKAIDALNAAADGDSNDVEIDAGQAVRDVLEELIAALT